MDPEVENLLGSVNVYSKSLETVSSVKLVKENFFGQVTSYNGQVIEATPMPAIIGSLCTIYSQNDEVFSGKNLR